MHMEIADEKDVQFLQFVHFHSNNAVERKYESLERLVRFVLDNHDNFV